MDNHIRKLVRREILELEGYRPECYKGGIKLDANECPYAPSFKLPRIALNRYPDPHALYLKKLLGGFWNVQPERILHGNGSDELIYYLISTVGGHVAYPVPTFSMYGIIAKILGQKIIEIPLDREFDIPVERFMKIIKTRRPRIIFLSSPNNPTGNCFSTDRILSIVKETEGVVVVDEAYQAYAENGNGFIPYTERYRNLLVMRTFSKIGFAGIRLGFVIGDKDILGEINKARLPYNVNSLTQAIAIQAIKDKRFFKDIVKKIIKERQHLIEGLSKLDGVTAYPSQANFILFKVKNADRVHKRLLKKGVIIKNLTGVIPDCLRVTVGKPGENRAFLRAIKEVL